MVQVQRLDSEPDKLDVSSPRWRRWQRLLRSMERCNTINVRFQLYLTLSLTDCTQQKLSFVENISFQKKETAYMLVYVEKSQAAMILRELTVDDIPSHVQQEYSDDLKKRSMLERKKKFFKVKVLCFDDLVQTSGQQAQAVCHTNPSFM